MNQAKPNLDDLRIQRQEPHRGARPFVLLVAAVADALLELPFDHVFFTGSPADVDQTYIDENCAMLAGSRSTHHSTGW